MKNKLTKYKIIITAGGTIAPIDPVRYIANHSTGKMGIAILKAALKKNFNVVFIYGNISVSLPSGNYKKIKIDTAQKMYNSIIGEFSEDSILIMAAAVSDFRIKNFSKEKIKKNSNSIKLELIPEIDILKNLGKIKTSQYLIGFSAETNDLLKNAKQKLKSKNLDMIIANDVSRKDIGFASDFNELTFIYKDGSIEKTNKLSKIKLGDLILEKIESILL